MKESGREAFFLQLRRKLRAAIQLLIFGRTVDCALFNPEVGLRNQASWTRVLTQCFDTYEVYGGDRSGDLVR